MALPREAGPRFRISLRSLRSLRFRLRLWKARLGAWRGTVVDAIEKTGYASQPLYFLQVGAHNGRDNDPVRPLVEKRGWRGILVEPLRPLFDELVRNYADCEGLIFENVAIAEVDGERSFFHVPAGAELPSWTSQIGSLDESTIRSHGALSSKLEGRIVESRLPCVTIRTLLEKHDSRPVNAVFIDAEGHDLAILRQLDLQHEDLVLVVFEHFHLSRRERAEAYRLLDRAGFRRRELAWDTVAHR